MSYSVVGSEIPSLMASFSIFFARIDWFWTHTNLMSGMIRQPNWLEIEIVQSRSLYVNLVASSRF